MLDLLRIVITRSFTAVLRVTTYLVGFEALHSLFLLLLPQDDEGTAGLVECQTHCCALFVLLI